MIDWHSHILPCMDDGSRDITESHRLLEMLKSQGVEKVIATPHYYANDESVEEFLRRRDDAIQTLIDSKKEGLPEIVLGAEVKYYAGISRMAELKRLRICGSKLLLLEMPMSRWTEYTVRELIELASSMEITIVLAHIERYLTLQTEKVWNRLYESGILMQVNATFFTRFSSKNKAVKYLVNGKINFIGSDCHNVTTRPPKLDKAFKIISKKLGDNFINQMNEYGQSLFTENIKT